MESRPPASAALPALPTTAATEGGAGALETEVVLLFDEFRDRLLRYLLTFGLDVADGEEIIQEIFLALFQHLQKGKSRQNLRGWLFQVAHNLALKRRAQSRRAGQGFEGQVADRAPNPEEQFANDQTERRLRAVILALPEQDRRCLSLRAEGLRYREIARVLDISLGSVSISLTRSLARLARARER